MARPLTKEDVEQGRVVYLEVRDRFIGSWWFTGPLTGEEARESAEGYRKAGCAVSVIAAPTGYQESLV